MAKTARRQTAGTARSRRRSGFRRIAPAAAAFTLALPAQALGAGGGVAAAFGALSAIGVVLIIGGLLFLVAPDILRLRDRASADTATTDEASGAAAHSAPEARAETVAGPEPAAPADPAQPASTERPRLVAMDGTPVTPRAERAAAASRPAPAPVAPVADAPSAQPAPAAAASSDAPTSAGEVFTAEVCSEFVGGLTDPVLGRAGSFFTALVEQGEVDSQALAGRLGGQPTELAGLLLTPLTRRADTVGVPAPFGLGRVKGTRRRLWLDRDGVAARMVAAIAQEQAARGIATAPDEAAANGAGLRVARR